jgi:hypothetical protein
MVGAKEKREAASTVGGLTADCVRNWRTLDGAEPKLLAEERVRGLAWATKSGICD